MVEETRLWIEKILLQLAAESYLDNLPEQSSDTYQDEAQKRLSAGANNYRLESNDPAVKGILEKPDEEHPTRMLSEQADDFLDNYEIVHHLPNRSSGFSATLMRNRQTGEYTLSFRSTEFRDEINGGDGSRDGIGGADSQIANRGFALGQLMQMEDYYNFLINDSNLINAQTRLNITGYSLGGQLATAFTAMHPRIVNETHIFNGVGLGDYDSTAGSLQQMINDYRSLLMSESQRLGEALSGDIVEGVTADIALVPTTRYHNVLWPFQNTDLPNLYQTASHLSAADAVFTKYRTLGASFIWGQTDTDKTPGDEINQKITQVYGAAAHNDMQIVANQGVNSSNEQAVYIEDQAEWVKDGNQLNLGGTFGDTHSIILVLDSLMLTEALQTIDPNLTRSAAELIYQSASAEYASKVSFDDGQVESDSLENVLDMMITLFVDKTWGESLVDIKSKGFGNFNNRNLYLENINRLKNKYQLLSENGAEFSIQSFNSSNADDWLVKSLDVTEGVAYRYALVNLNPFVVLTDSPLYDLHNETAYKLYDPVSGEGVLTENYLRDRLELLSVKNAVSLGDLPLWSVEGFDSRRYFDTAYFDSDQSVLVDGRDINVQHVIFSDGDDIHGTYYNDRLYAGEGDNVFLPGDGDDYMQGGAGNDVYILKSSNGFDEILDTDGLGRVELDGASLNGGERLSGNIFRSADSAVTYVLVEHDDTTADLYVNDVLKIHNFKNGDLGITLDDNVFVSEGGSTLLTNNADFFVEYLQQPLQLAALAGNDLVSMHNPSFFAIDGGAGNDWLYGADQSERLSGGSGYDVVMPGRGADIIDAGDGDDLVDSLYTITDLTGSGIVHEKRVWLDIANNFSIESDAQIESVFDEQITFYAEAVLPQVSFSGVSYDGVYDFYFDAEEELVTYTGVEDESITFTLDVYTDYTQVTDAASKWIYAGSGNDMVYGNDGADTIAGGDGNDRIAGGNGNDVLSGDDDQDILLAGFGNDLLDGGSGSDILLGDKGSDRLFGGAGDDLLFGDHEDVSTADAADDYLYGGDGNDILVGHGGNDRLGGGNGDDRLFANEGNDYLTGGQGSDHLQAGDGDDYLSGDSGVDYLFGQAGSDYLCGGSGNDVLRSGDGNDVLSGGKGSDELDGADGQDTYLFSIGDGHDFLWDSSTQNSMLFGYGIAFEDITLGYRIDDGVTELTLNYGDSDSVTIVDYKINDFVSLTFLDEPATEHVFSSLFSSQAATANVAIIPGDTGFFWGDSDDPGNSVVQVLHTQDERLSVTSHDDLRLQNYRADFVSSMQQDVYDYLQGNDYFQSADGTFEITDEHGWLYQVSGKSVYSMFDEYAFSRPSQIEHTLLSRQYFSTTVSVNQPVYPGISNQAVAEFLTDKDEASLFESFQLPENATGIHIAPVVFEKTEVPADTYQWRQYEAGFSQMMLEAGDQADHINLYGSYFNLVSAGGGDDWVSGVDGYSSTVYQGGNRIYLPLWESMQATDWSGSFIDGGSGNDHIIGSYLHDFLVGGQGNDVLRGLSGNDSYYLSAQNGHDLIYDDGSMAVGDNDHDRIIMPEGIIAESLTLKSGWQLFATPVDVHPLAEENDRFDMYAMQPHATLTLQWSDNDSVTVVLPYSKFEAGYGIDQVDFSDGTSVSMHSLMQTAGIAPLVDIDRKDNQLISGGALAGGAGNDYLQLQGVEQADTDLYGYQFRRDGYFSFAIGGDGSDSLFGSAGDDYLFGGHAFATYWDGEIKYRGSYTDAGNIYRGNQGDDVIWSTSGNDVFVFQPGDGNDFIIDPFFAVHDSDAALSGLQQSGADTLVLSGGITAEDIEFSRSRSYTRIELNSGNGEISFAHNDFGAGHQFKNIVFSDGMVWQMQDASSDMSLYQQVSSLAAAAAGFVETSLSQVSFTEQQVDALPDLFAVS